MESAISLKRFSEELELKLSKMEADKLRELIWSFAGEVKPAERRCFLSKISSPYHSVSIDENILDEIEGLLEEIAQSFDEEPDWEEYYNDEESLKIDERILEDFSNLFDRVNFIFDSGKSKLAKQAYERLFEAFELEDDYGRYISPCDLSCIDLKETRARYLRSIYLSSSKALTFIPELYDQIQETRSFFRAERPSLTEILDVSVEPLPGWNQFLEVWIGFLNSKDSRCSQFLLREAILIKDGISGLEALSRSQGLRQPRVFYDIVAYYRKKGEEKKALEAARNALFTLPEGLPVRASIANLMMDPARTLQDEEALSLGAWISFKEKPNTDKLVDLYLQNEGTSSQKIMKDAVEVLRKCLSSDHNKNRGTWCPDSLWETDDIERASHPSEVELLHAYLFAGMQEEALSLTGEEKELGWSCQHATQPLFLSACFFLALPIKAVDECPRNIRRFWENAFSGRRRSSCTETSSDTRMEEMKKVYEVLKERTNLKPHPKAIDWCLKIAEKRIFSIVSNQHRGAYGRAALLTMVCSEFLQLTGKEQEAIDFYAKVKGAFPRHSAFQRELRAL